jgi:HSP20 family protein
MFGWGLRRDPFWSEFTRIQRGLDDLARQMTGAGRSYFDPWIRTARIFPLLNVVKTDNSFIITAEIPGIDPDDLEVKVEGDTLTLKGERKPEQLGEGVSYHRRERTSGTFHRSLSLPSNVESEEVKANYTDGILTITLPMAKAELPKQIAVTTE